MDNTYQSALQWLIAKCEITTEKDYVNAANAIVAASKKFPNYYREFPDNERQIIEKEIFEAEAIVSYMQDKVGTNQLAIYQQDVVRKLMKLRRGELKQRR